ncbi:type 1 glutamine amidotransferase domain-containing protein [Roseibium salinum]|uniref:Type 1 glutamine amidotransferase n=1 Tax=Roseibium salinum TaxID=1604349 RepID=A0ABT3R659_9HYPH|nr:type 1 glutamine amidotransferase domain-containing protein [Roseibium sp. DSM 29163]MCX2724523.1 type 1 glutamine amidotransferase [Roseibium sp. DSM 29163]
MTKITDAKIVIIATHGFEQSELEVPLEKLRAQGAEVHVASPDGSPIIGWNNKDWGDSVKADLKIEDIAVNDYIAVVLPGGQINPDLLRVDKTTVDKIREFADKGKIVAAICHAPWLLIEAGVAKGREMTSYHSIRTDLANAGAKVLDKEVVNSNGIITSRNPDDLDAFVAKIVEEVQEGEHRRNAA